MLVSTIRHHDRLHDHLVADADPLALFDEFRHGAEPNELQVHRYNAADGRPPF